VKSGVGWFDGAIRVSQVNAGGMVGGGKTCCWGYI